jgi:small subunit ribosomal protein S9
MEKNKNKEFIGTGRRKTAVASILIKRGTGKFDVNGRDLDKYFLSLIQRNTVLSPLKNNLDIKNYDFIIRLKGGGIEAQAVAARLGISRALVKNDETLRGSLKELGYLTRDPRKKERKKYGLAGARKRFQFSKR